MDKYKRLVSNSIIFALGTFTVKAAQFFILSLLTKYLLESQYGIIENIVITLQDLIMPVLTLGLAEALFRFSVDKQHSQNEIITNSFAVVVIGIVAFAVFDLIFYFAAKAAGSQYSETYMLLLIPLFAFKSIKNLLAEFTRGIGKSVHYALSSIIESAVMLAVAAVLIIYADAGIYGYILSLVASPVVGIIFLTVTVNPLKYFSVKSFNKQKLRQMLRYSVPNVSNSISWWIVQSSSRYLMVYLSVLAVGGVAGYKSLLEDAWAIAGIYTAASKLPSLINVVSYIFLQAWSLSSSQEVENSDKNVFYSNVFEYFTPVVFTAAICVFIVLPYVSKILLQGGFYKGWVYSPFLIMGAVTGCFSSFFGAFFGAFYKTKWAMYTALMGAAANLLICGIFMPVVAKFYDMEAVVYVAAIAFWISYGIIFISRVIVSNRLVAIDTNWFKFISQYLLVSLISVIYTLNLQHKWVFGICALIVLVMLNIKKLLFIFKKLLKRQN